MTFFVRAATPADLAHVESIENLADALLVQHLGPTEWPAAPEVSERCHEPGFILVARADDLPSDSPPVGFVHVLEVDECAHLEQVSVLPDFGRRGIGAQLVRAAMAEAIRLGHRRMTLRTYADVPWNAPFYARLGFAETQPDTEFLRGLVDLEEMLGLPAWGRRVQMERSLGGPFE